MNRLIIFTASLVTSIALDVTFIENASAQAYQNTPVTVSTEKVRNNGKVYYSHIVLERQTLYSICKAYGVTAEEVYRHNPKIQEAGLKKGDIVLIPIKDEKQERQAALDSLTRPSEQKAEEIQEVEAAPKNEEKAEQKAAGKKVHVKKWFEDIEDIAAKYGVTVSDLMQANGLKDSKLSNRQKLIIPEPGEYDVIEQPTEIKKEEITSAESKTDTTSLPESPADTLIAPPADTSYIEETMILYPKEKVNVTLMLPLKTRSGTISRNNMDFYSGVLLALHDLKEEGVRTEMNVYDIAPGGDLISVEALDSTDVIIGPVSSSEISRYLKVIPKGKKLISPLDPRAEKIAMSDKRVIQAPTPHEYQYKDLASWLKEDMTPADTVLFITEKDFSSSVGDNLKGILDSLHITCNRFSYTILEGRDVLEPLTALMTATGVNRVVIGSDNEAFVNDVIRNLNLLVYNKLNVVLYGTSKIRGFETIEAENFHNTSMKVSLGYHIDYNSPPVKSFLLKYRALFNTEPTQYAYQGYDITRYFVSLCYKYGDRWPQMLQKEEKEMLQNTFRFVNNEDGGYINTGVRRLSYGSDWILERIR